MIGTQARARIALPSVSAWLFAVYGVGGWVISHPPPDRTEPIWLPPDILVRALSAAPLVILFPMLWWWAEARFASRSALVRVGTAAALTTAAVIAAFVLLAAVLVVVGVR